MQNDPINKNGGRPSVKKEAKKSHRVHFACNENEYQMLTKLVAETNYTKSDFCRIRSLYSTIQKAFTEEEHQLKVDLVGMRNNLNQLTRLAHIGGIESQLDSLKTLLKTLDSIIEKHHDC
jgi:hypothetical protein